MRSRALACRTACGGRWLCGELVKYQRGIERIETCLAPTREYISLTEGSIEGWLEELVELTLVHPAERLGGEYPLIELLGVVGRKWAK